MSKSWAYRLSTILQNYDFRLTNQQQNASNFSHLMPTALLFDLGTVIIDIDPSLTVAAFRKLLGEHSDRLLAQTNWEEWHRQLEIGALSAEAFINRIQSASPVPLHGREIVNAWNATLIGIPAWRIELLKALKKDYRLFLLSNTDPIHMTWIREYVRRTFGIADFEHSLFERAFLSYEVNARKPDSLIYKIVLEETGISPGEYLFIDDKKENVDGARAIGIPSIQYPPERGQKAES